jgi:hypothetical protein
MNFETALDIETTPGKTKPGEVQLWRKYHDQTNGGFKGCKKKYGFDWRTLKGLKDSLEKAGYDWLEFDIVANCDLALSIGERLDELKMSLHRNYGVPLNVLGLEDGSEKYMDMEVE